MLKQEMQNEIDALRAKLEQLEAEREVRAKQPDEARNDQVNKTESATQDPDVAEPAGDEAEATVPEEADLNNLFQELIDTVEDEFKESNPLTVLVVFAVGVLVGRLLAR